MFFKQRILIVPKNVKILLNPKNVKTLLNPVTKRLKKFVYIIGMLIAIVRAQLAKYRRKILIERLRKIEIKFNKNIVDEETKLSITKEKKI